ncbi:MAG: NAD(P)-dependent oxidoreductase [Thermodesulfovibrionia bacterium]
MKALVTGASGFIGSHLTERLIKEGFEVFCLRRRDSDVRWLSGGDIRFIYGDCCDKESLSSIRDFDYIFHLAGIIKANSEREFFIVNEEGTQNLIEVVSRNNPNIKRFVYLSSLSAYGPALQDDHLPSEDGLPHPVSNYGRSKLKGEDVVLKYSSNIPVCILRPSVVYGPRDRQFLLFFKFINRGFVPYWGEGHTSLIYIDDLIDAIILSIEKDEAIGSIYFVSDGMVYSNNQIIDEIALALDKRVVKVRLPRPILPLIGIFADGIGKIKGRASMINKDKIKEIMYNDWVCDITKAKSELGFRPNIGIKEGMRWTADWYRTNGWI